MREKNTALYNFFRKLAFAGDSLFSSRGLLQNTKLRMSLADMESLSTLMGREIVYPLEKEIIQYRIRIYRGNIVRIIGYIGLLYTFGSQTSTIYTTALFLSCIGLGEMLDIYDRNSVFSNLKREVLRISHEFIVKFNFDFYGKPETAKAALVQEFSDAIALGESLAHPQLMNIVITTVISLTLLAAHQFLLAFILISGTVLLQYALRKSLHQAKEWQELLDKHDEHLKSVVDADHLFSTQLLKKHSVTIWARQSQDAWDKASRLQSTTQLILSTILPVLAVLTGQGAELAITLAGIITQFNSSLWENQKDYGQIHNGITKLSSSLNYLCSNAYSLMTAYTLKRHLKANHTLPPALSLPKKAVAFIGAFSMQVLRRKHIFSPDLTFYPGIALIQDAPARAGKSVFLYSLLHRIEAKEEKESYIKINSKWKKLHSLSAEKIRRLLLYLSTEPQYNQLPPAFFFSLFTKAHKTNDLRSRYLKKLLQRYLKKVISVKELDAILQAASLTSLPSHIRTKLRLIHALEMKPCICSLDTILDTLTQSEFLSIMSYLVKYAHKNKTAFILITHKHYDFMMKKRFYNSFISLEREDDNIKVKQKFTKVLLTGKEIQMFDIAESSRTRRS